MPMTLLQLQEHWEGGGELIVDFESRGALCRVLRYSQPMYQAPDRMTYSLHRYFTVDGVWCLSVDHADFDADAMMQVIKEKLA
jgi:hypothetical protein